MGMSGFLMIVGIGAADFEDKILQSIHNVGKAVHVRCYTTPAAAPKFSGIDIVESGHPEEALISHLMSGEIAAAVRGTLPANSTLAFLKAKTGRDHLERIAYLETADGTRFLLAPVGVDEGWTADQKIALIKQASRIAGVIGINSRVAVLSGGRFGDIGRHERVDQSLAQAELVARMTRADHREILIEDAIRDHGIIIAPDGITGNLIFRTLTFLGAGKGHGAPVVNIDKIFVDTSRASADYANAILLAAALFKNQK